MLQIAAKYEAQEKRISSEIQRIAKEAWLATDSNENPDERFRLAKHEALRLIHLLSPSIRREVEHRFTSQKWALILNRS